MRISLVSVVFLATLAALAAPATAQAELFPADTFAYAEVDARALAQGAPELQVVKLLGDEKLRKFLGPFIERLDLDPDEPAKSLLALAQVDGWLAGKAAIGVRGVRVVVREGEGAGARETRFELTPARPLDARTIYRALGLAARLGNAARPAFEVEIGLDFLAVIEPGPRLKAAVAELLEAGGSNFPSVRIGGREVRHLKLPFPAIWGILSAGVYADFSGDRWILGTNKDVLSPALQGGPPRSLADAAKLGDLRKEFTGGRPLLLGYVDFAVVRTMIMSLVPPIVGELNDLNGLNSLRGIGFGVSFAGGGVRETVGLVLDGDPQGVWRLFDALPGGMRSLERAPPGAVAVVGFKFDAGRFLQRAREVTATLLPGNEAWLDDALEAEFRRLGFDFKNEILPALGDEVALLVYPVPQGQILPDVVLGTDTKNEEALRKLVDKLRAGIPADVATFQPIQLTDEIEGFQVFSRLPLQTTVAVRGGHLFVASRIDLLRDVLTKWGSEDAPRLVRDGEVFPHVLRALNGGNREDLVALAYLNLRAALLPAFPVMRSQLPRGLFDATVYPDVRRLAGHLDGAAIGVRRSVRGIYVDFYSPIGLLVPGTVAAIAGEVEQQRRWRRQAVAVAVPRGRAALGINVRSSDGTGVTVIGMFDTAPVARAGLKENDKIVAVDGVKVGLIEELDREIVKHAVGDEVLLTVRRGAATITCAVTLGDKASFENR